MALIWLVCGPDLAQVSSDLCLSCRLSKPPLHHFDAAVLDCVFEPEAQHSWAGSSSIARVREAPGSQPASLWVNMTTMTPPAPTSHSSSTARSHVQPCYVNPSLLLSLEFKRTSMSD